MHKNNFDESQTDSDYRNYFDYKSKDYVGGD